MSHETKIKIKIKIKKNKSNLVLKVFERFHLIFRFSILATRPFKFTSILRRAQFKNGSYDFHVYQKRFFEF
jgi:hypothetical protein